MRGTKTATILVMVGTGSKYEKKEEGGISHFLEHLFFKGTKNRPNTLALSAELDSIGAMFNAFTTKEFTGYWVKADAAKLELGFDVVSDMLLNSLFSPEEIEREKGVIIEELNMYQDNPMMFIEDVFEECLYGDTPAGRDVIGTKSTIRNVTREMVVNYLKDQYGAQNTVVAVAGNIDKTATEQLALKYFEKYGITSGRVKENLLEDQTEPAVKIGKKKTDQAHLALGVRAFPTGHKDEYAARMLGIILGGSMSARLFLSLREKHGLAYYVRTGTESYSDSGYLVTQAGVPVGKIDDAIKIILEEYRLLADKLVDAKEFQRNKDLLRGRMHIQLESSDDVAQWYAKRAVMLIGQNKRVAGLPTPEKFLEKFDALTAEELKRVAGGLFTDKNLNLAVIGPYEDKEKFKTLLKIG
jgi:predicted Zn-dependent peptidase